MKKNEALLDSGLYGYMLDEHAWALGCSWGTPQLNANLGDFWTPCENELVWFLEDYLEELDYESERRVKFLVMIDYLTYIPCGEKGYAKMREMLADHVYKGKRFSSVAEYRFERLKDGVGKRITNLPQEHLDLIYGYFKRYEKTEYDMMDLFDATCFFCRFHHQIESLYGREGLADTLDIYDYSDENVKIFGEGSVVQMQDILDQLEESDDLGKKEEAFICQTTGISKPRKKKEDNA